MKKLMLCALLGSLAASSIASAGVYIDREQLHERNVTFYTYEKRDDMISYHQHVEKDTRFIPLVEFDNLTPNVDINLSTEDSVRLYIGYELERKVTSD